MAKKVVATISSGTKGFVKIITAVKSKRDEKAISFKQQMMPIEKADDFIKSFKRA